MSDTMTKKQQHFLMVMLPKFILREQGHGFKMSGWMIKGKPGETTYGDDIDRPIPKCGTVACIGGSTQFLHELQTNNDSEIAKILGLTLGEEEGLCYRWRNQEGRYSWPMKFIERYKEAKTTLAKAKVAASLCKLVGKTKGRCLHLEGK